LVDDLFAEVGADGLLRPPLLEAGRLHGGGAGHPLVRGEGHLVDRHAGLRKVAPAADHGLLVHARAVDAVVVLRRVRRRAMNGPRRGTVAGLARAEVVVAAGGIVAVVGEVAVVAVLGVVDLAVVAVLVPGPLAGAALPG